MEYIDLNTWKRKEHFDFFRGMDYPHYNICANIDATNFLNFVKKNKLSFYYAMIYASTRAANEIVNFRYRLRGDKVVLHDKVHPSFTDLNNAEDDLFKIVTVEMKDDLFEFVEYCKEASQKQKKYFDIKESADSDEWLYITCIPWISFTHVSHPISLDKNDSVPRISWGKYFSENNGGARATILLPFSVQVHHAFIDGVHVGRYFSYLQNYIDSL